MKVTLIVDEVAELFQDYLKRCDIFKSFLTAADIDTEEGLSHYVEGFYTSNISYDLLIDYAFSWDDTDEGVTFWSHKDQAWRNFLLEQTNTSFKTLSPFGDCYGYIQIYNNISRFFRKTRVA